MLLSVKHSQTSMILRVKLLDKSQTDGRGITGLTNTSTGLSIAAVADNEDTGSVYTTGSSNVEGITTLGTWADPTSGKCRFKEVSSTNHKGVYELQFANARFSVAGARSLLVSIQGTAATDTANLMETNFVVQLDDLNEVADAIFKRDWSAITGEAARSALNALRFLRNKWSIAAGTLTVTKEDDSTTAWTAAVTTNAAADPVTASDPA
jgi:hypothetical protein